MRRWEILGNLNSVGEFCSTEKQIASIFCHWPTSYYNKEDAQRLDLSTISSGRFFLFRSRVRLLCALTMDAYLFLYFVFPSNGLIEAPFIVQHVPFGCIRWSRLIFTCHRILFYDSMKRKHTFLSAVIKIKIWLTKFRQILHPTRTWNWTKFVRCEHTGHGNRKELKEETKNGEN